MRFAVLAWSVIAMGLPALSAAQDSTRAPLFTARDAWMAGAFAVGTAAVMPLDRSLAERLQLPSNQAKSGYRNAATAFRELGDPGTVIIAGGMYITGWLSRNALLTDVGLHSGEAIVAASVAGTAAKLLTGRARPRVNVEDPHSFAFGRGLRSNDYQSFPSGHTYAAFALASSLTAEVERRAPGRALLTGVLTYGAATLVGLSRMYNNAHWASDVVLAAGVGTLAGVDVVRWQHTHPGNWIDRTFQRVSLVPTASGGAALAVHLDAP